jgi:hypothetical protein
MADSADERLVIMLEARISEFEKRMARAEKTGTKTYNGLKAGSAKATDTMARDMVSATERINKSLASTTLKIGDFAKGFAGGIVGGFAAAALGAITSDLAGVVQAIAEVGDEAKRAGLAVDDFQRLKYVAEQNRIGVDSLTDGLKEMALRADEVIQTGGGAASEAFARLGFSAADLGKSLKDPSSMFLEITERLQGMDKAAQIRIADEVFGGTGGEQFVQLLDQGADGIRATMAEADRLGVVMDQNMVAKAELLNAKLNAAQGYIAAIWQRGVIGAAEYFGFLDKMGNYFKSETAAEGIIGKDLADRLGADPAAVEKVKQSLEDIGYIYDDLERQISVATDAIGNDFATLIDAGADDLALQLNDVTGEMQNLVAEVRAGTVPAAELKGRMTALVDEARAALIEANKIDGVDLSGAVGAVDRVSSALEVATGWAAGLVDKMREAAGLEAVGAGTLPDPVADEGGIGNRTSTPSTLAPMTSSAPRRAPALLGESGKAGGGAKSKGRSGGGGAGKAENRLESVLADLQTEKEAVQVWYAESLELLNASTDVQLKAVGGKHEALERLETEHKERLASIRGESDNSGLAHAETFFGALATITASGTGKIAKISKAAAAVEAGINTLRAQAQVLADPKLGFWAKLPAMAAIGAAGFGIVSALGGGGSKSASGSTSGSTSGASTSGDAVGTSSGAVSPLAVTLQGLDAKQFYQGQAIIDLAEALQKEFGKRGFTLGFTS